MALQAVTNINIDFYDKKYILINAKQLDKKTRFLSVTCYNHGELYPINSGEHSAYIRYKKSDEHGVFNLCDINAKGKILVELTEQMLSATGICYADLVIVNKGSAKVNEDTGEIVAINNSGILSTMTFCIDVSETAVENSEIESSYEYDGLNEALEKAEAEYSQVVRMAKSYAHGGTGERTNEDTDNAKYYYEQAKKNSANAETYMNAASNSATAASKSAVDANTSAQNAQTYMGQAKTYMNNAQTSADASATSVTTAAASETNAAKSATSAQNSMTSATESATNASKSATEAKGYLQQAETVVNGLNGAFSPKGTITFAELMALKDSGAIAAGDLYHISDNFTTDENFRISGKECGAGTSVYYTVDDQFDFFVGATVAGIKRGNETEYKTGMVEITAENVGAIPSADIATVDEVKELLGII